MSEYDQAHLQRIQDHVQSLDDAVSILSAVAEEPKQRIDETFASDPRMVIVMRGVQRGLSQRMIAQALRERGLKGAQQARVSNTFRDLERQEFIRQTPKRAWVANDAWKRFGLDRVMRKTLKDHGVEDLP